MSEKDCEPSEITFSSLMLPQDANPSGNVHGGVIMKRIDSAGGVVAQRHARSNVVTASIDRLEFHHPVFIGNLLTLKASMNLVGNTSMEIGVRAEAEDLKTGVIRHVASAYLTFVALDGDGRPIRVPAYEPTTADAIRRHRMAINRRERRLAERQLENDCKSDADKCQ